MSGSTRSAPYRFAVTAALFRASGLPVVLMLSHQLGGGVQRHIDELVARLAGRANVLLLQASDAGQRLVGPGAAAGPLLTCRRTGWTTWPRCCAPPRCRACMCIT